MGSGIKLVLVAVCSISFVACGADDQPGQVADSANFSGRYEGTVQGIEGGIAYDTALTIILSQVGNQINGNYSSGLGASGSVSGSVDGNVANFIGSDLTTGCTFSGSGTLNGDRITGKVIRLGGGGCLSLDATIDLTRQGSVPVPTEPVGQPNWNTVTLTVMNGSILQFRVDDIGNYFASPSGISGQVTTSELLRLDSRIDAIKEEAHDDFECALSPVPLVVDGKISITFENRSPAVVYETDAEINRECWSGDYLSVLLLNGELADLQVKYTLG
jgi:hypothetical protein